MKVLHINCNYFGHNPVHKNMINAMNKIKGLDNYVFSPVSEIITDGVDNRIVASNCINKYDRLFFNHKSKKIRGAITKEFNISEFDLMHAYTIFTDGNVAYELSKKYSIPYVVAVRNTDVNVFFKYMPHLRKRGINIMLNSKYVFFLSESYRQFVFDKYIPKKYKKIIMDKSVIIPNGIGDFWLKNVYYDSKSINEKINLLDKKVVNLVYVGEIDKNKNLITTCNAIELLKKDGWKVEYDVAGKIKDESVFNKTKKYMNYNGVLQKEKLIDLYRKSHIFVMPSLTETFGLVYVEAISQNVPVIYSKGQGFDKQFEEGIVGYSVDSKDAVDLKNKIIKIIENYKKITNKMSKNVYNYSWEDLSKKYFDLYNTAIVNKKQ